MKSQGIIFHGSNNDVVMESAYNFAIEYMSQGEGEKSNFIKKHIYANTYPNFLLIKKQDDEDEISVEEMRKIIEFLSHKPNLRGKRVVIVVNFEDASRNAANSVLKILEEPPIDSILILTTTKFQSILPTIRSRCIKNRILRSFLPVMNFENSLEFAKAISNDLDHAFIEKVINFIDEKRPNKIEFSKQNAENLKNFLNILTLHYSFLCSKKKDLSDAKKVFALQNFANLIRNTYPDKQAAMIAACEI